VSLSDRRTGLYRTGARAASAGVRVRVRVRVRAATAGAGALAGGAALLIIANYYNMWRKQIEYLLCEGKNVLDFR
jgi:hypothetical protein